MECLDANAVQDFMAGALEPAVRAAAIEHLDRCPDCRALISLLARDVTRDAAIASIALGKTRGNAERSGDRIASLALGEARSNGDTTDTLRDRVGLLETMASADPLGETAAITSSDPTAPRRVPLPSQTGRTFDRYTVAERLGAGAMGVVYRADDQELKRSVALKLLHRPDPGLTERLIREARSMAKVNHPNVVTVYDVGVADGSTYIAMELVPGGSLRAWLGERHTIPEVIEAFVAAGRGLAAAHAAGVVHRDFKPDNVLFGGDGRVRVTDFGLASSRLGELDPAHAPAPDELSLTHSGMVLGTPAYMAPEQFTGGNVDARTDQFNFCVALYEALYGHRPFTGKTFEDLGNNVCDGKVRAAPAKTRVSGGLRAIVLRGLASLPGDRYPTMDHLLEELGRDRAKPWRRAAIAATAVGIALGIGLVADLVVRSRTGSEIRQSFTATGRQTNRAMELLASRFDAAATQVYFLPVFRSVAATRDQQDLGLGATQADDDKVLAELHDELASVDWTLSREIAGRHYEPVIAIADRRGRLLYTSAMPTHWRVDLTTLPWVKAALDGKARTTVLVAMRDPKLASTGLYGTPTSDGVAIFFTRTMLLAEEAAAQLLYIADARHLIDEIRLDDETRLSLVAPDGTADGTVPADLVTATPLDDTAVSEIRTAGTSYLVQSQPIRLERTVAGYLVMARPFASVLSLFPGARIVFALAMLGAFGAALSTALRARRITNARV